MTSSTNSLLARVVTRRRPRRPDPAAAREVVLRLDRPDDRDALERLAELDSRSLPEGSFVVAVVDGELVAAVPVDMPVRALADPFRPTASVVALAVQRARDVQRADGRRPVARARLLASA